MIRALALVIVCVVLLPAAAAFAAAQRVPAGAYVRKPVSSVEELAAHINKDPVVRNRFARHFGVSPERLDEYIKDNVVITRVSKSTPRDVYICTRSGRLISQRKVLKSGTPIFALKDTGEPLLVLSCGNPVVKALPPRVKVKAEGPQVYQVMRPNEVPLPPPVAVLPPVTAAPPPAPVAAPPVTPAVVPPVTVSPVAPVSRGPGLLPLIPLIPLIGNSGNGGGPPPPPIPEPGGTAAVAATALLPAAGWGIRKLRSRRLAEPSEQDGS